MQKKLSPELLTNIVQTMSEGLFVVDEQGVIRLVNDALCQMLGYSREELEANPCTVLDCDQCEKHRFREKGRWCRLFEARRELGKTCLVRKKDGSYLKVLKNASALMEGDKIIGGVETLTDLSELDRREERIKDLTRRLGGSEGFHGIIGESPVIHRACELMERASGSDAPVIIYGESGTGKELAAQAIHRLGPRRDGPFIQFNCAAFNESLLESELFGHAKGAFTGAYRHRQGRFEAASGGDILLDEIGDVPLKTQVKLLRVLETKSFERVGEHQPVAMDARIITATNKNLAELVARGEFREDFFFRINVIPIPMPPLRDHPEDLPLLADHFIRTLNQHAGKEVRGLSSGAMRAFMEHDWPGNVRELKSALEYAFVTCDSQLIGEDHLPPQFTGGEPLPGTRPACNLSRQQAELMRALDQARGNKSEAARILGVSRVTVLNRMRKYGLATRIEVTAT